MRVEVLFLRWILVISVVAMIIIYARSSRRGPVTSQYEAIQLVAGGQSAGLPLAGVAIDPDRGNVYAIVGGATAKDSIRQFCVVWRGKEGKAYGTTFPPEGGANNLFVVSSDGQVEAMRPLVPDRTEQPADAKKLMPDTVNTLRSVVEALPVPSQVQ